LFIVPCQLSLAFARQTMCPVTLISTIIRLQNYTATAL